MEGGFSSELVPFDFGAGGEPIDVDQVGIVAGVAGRGLDQIDGLRRAIGVREEQRAAAGQRDKLVRIGRKPATWRKTNVGQNIAVGRKGGRKRKKNVGGKRRYGPDVGQATGRVRSGDPICRAWTLGVGKLEGRNINALRQGFPCSIQEIVDIGSARLITHGTQSNQSVGGILMGKEIRNLLICPKAPGSATGIDIGRVIRPKAGGKENHADL